MQQELALLQTQELLKFWQVKLAKIAFIILISLVVYWIIKAIFRKLVGKLPQKRLTTILSLLNNITGFVIFAVAALMILTELDINITPILASAGIAGLAIGFGAQTLVKDLISGIFILAEDQIRVGDIVKIKEVEGEVERIGLRTISVRDFSGKLVQIPNSDIQLITNLTRDWSQVDLKIGVATKNSVDKVLETLQKIADQFARDKEISGRILSPPQILGIEEITGEKMIIRVAIKTKPKKQFNISRRFLYSVKKAFEEKSIEFA